MKKYFAKRNFTAPLALAATMAMGAMYPVAQSEASALPAFYDVPNPIPDAPAGTLIRHQFAGMSIKGATLHRIMYATRTVSGQPTVVTGLVAVPIGSTPGNGWPIVTHGHGSTGLADDCSTSYQIGKIGVNLFPGVIEFDHVVGTTTKARHVLVSSDFEGLGGPGRHPFLVGVSEGRALLDGARAARQLPDIKTSGDIAIVGYSQGGHAALWARQIAKAWAPELRVVGTFVGAPASEVVDLMRNGAALSGAYGTHVVGGMAAAYPMLNADDVLTASGKSFLAESDRTCIPKSTGTGPWLSIDITKVPEWANVLAENTPGNAAGSGPVLIYHGAGDTNIPPAHSQKLLERLCKTDKNVERRVVPLLNHTVGMFPAYTSAMRWISGLNEQDAPVRSSCPSS